ncbi:hypothetical protein NM688_g173 [Phlebia brevispora]|uniref:Uncharacterized protein n=1 Tax=Phlebia brevispora TaxID=194682 RepID=A0ACC1TF85_9APHY|nr:hypothetical protein NM688_g173 [Phlebia brevispora]
MPAPTLHVDFLTVYKADLVLNYSVVATLSIVCYEFISTWRHEHTVLWGQKWTGATWLFLANRYSIVAAIIVQVSPFSPASHHSFLRAASLCIARSCVCYRRFDIGARSGPGGFESPTLSCAIIADLIAITITWIKTYRHVRDASAVGIRVGFSAALLEYGTLYFVKWSGPSRWLHTNHSQPSFLLANPISPFANVLPNVILSRFLINLRQVNTAGPSSVTHLSRFSVPRFHMPSVPTIIGNLGEPLAPGEEHWDNEDCDIVEARKRDSSAISEPREDAGIPAIDPGEISQVSREEA